MGIFNSVTLEWDGKDFVIPPDKVLGAIAIIEEQITFPELVAALQRGRPPLVTIARAFAGVLRYAGGVVTDEETYAGMFDVKVQDRIVTAINTLLVMMVPPESIASRTNGVTPSGNLRAAGSRRSKRSTKRRSGKAG